MQKRLGQEEHFSKELAILNNKLQTNMQGIYKLGEETHTTEVYNIKHHHHHIVNNDDLDIDSDGILQRKRAWAELEREQEEVKRNIKNLVRTAPESRVMEDPLLADRVRGVRYEPLTYNQEKQQQLTKESSIKEDAKQSSSTIYKEKPKVESIAKSSPVKQPD